MNGDWQLSVMFIIFAIILSVGLYLTWPRATMPITHSNTKLDAFIIVNEHDGLSYWGLEQLDQLSDEQKDAK